MLKLPGSLRAWGNDDFRAVCKAEIEALDITELPLQQGLGRTSHVSDTGFGVMIIDAAVQGDDIVVRAGVFYAGVIAGCSCADDPTPVDEVSEYCEIEISIDRTTATATVRLLPDA